MFVSSTRMNDKKSTAKYYVYALLDTRKPGQYIYNDLILKFEPFYIGKGTKKRMDRHFYEFGINLFKERVSDKILLETGKPHIALKLYEHLTDDKSKEIEIKLISLIGRRSLGKGPLTNLTDGGDGTSGCIPSKEKCSKISKSLKGVPLTNQRRENIKSARSKIEYKLISPENEVIVTKNIRQFCRDRNLNNGAMYQVLKGTVNHHKHWRRHIDLSLK